MNRLLIVLVLGLFVPALPGADPFRPAPVPFRFPAAKHGKSEMKYINGLPVLIVEGTPEEMGEAIGKLALKPASRVLGYPRDLLKALKIDWSWKIFLGNGKAMYKNFPPEFSKELEAITKASGGEKDLVIAGNTFFDIKKVVACSGVVLEKSRTASGGTVLARNLDYPPLGYIHEYSLVTIYRPKGKLSFAAVGFPGLVGTLSGMNEAGLALGVLEVFDVKGGKKHYNGKGIPYGLCLRTLLQECKTIEEAKKRLEKMPRTTTINVIIADKTSVGVLEVTPETVVLRQAEKGTCVTTNHFNSATLKPVKGVNIDRSFERFAKLAEIRTWTKKADMEDLRKQLHAVNLGSFTLQTMIFEPGAGKLHLSIGTVPASKGPLKKLDLTSLLGKQPARGVESSVKKR